MATNPYVNKVIYGNDTIMDISDTTAEAEDVANGKKFYDRSGAPQLGTGTGGGNNDLLRDTVGWISGNILGIYNYKYTSDGYFIYDTNNTHYQVVSPLIKVNEGDVFTASKKEAGSSGQAMWCYQYDDTKTFISSVNVLDVGELSKDYTVPSGVAYIGVRQSTGIGMNKTTQAEKEYMFCRKGTVAEYEDFNPPVKYYAREKAVYEVKNTVGFHCKNLLECTMSEQTISGVTLTPQRDSKGNLQYININGSSSALIDVTVGQLTLPAGDYIACDINEIYNLKGNSYITVVGGSDIGVVTNEGLAFTLNADTTIKYRIELKSGQSFSNTKTNPQICKADAFEPLSYEPYHKTVEDELISKYDTSDAAETAIADSDYFPFYDTSALGKRKTLWSNIKAVLKTYFDTIYSAGTISHVGMIIHSTTLDTEAKVKNIYGGTTWIQLSGYMLRGAVEDVTPNQDLNDGGADSVEVTNVAEHTHTQNQHSHTIEAHINYTSGHYHQTSVMSKGPSQQNSGANGGTMNATATNQNAGASYNLQTLPKYKNVYIWERTE